jgi:hypothetical protein
MRGEEAAARLERSASWLSRLESGQIGIRAKELSELLDTYGIPVGPLRDELQTLAAQGRRRAWWSSYRDSLPDDYYQYIGFEAEATRIDWSGSAVIPGWLQTEAYARALVRQLSSLPPAVQDDRVAVRMRRKALVLGSGTLPFGAVLGEAALVRDVGDRDVMHDQLKAIGDAMDRPNVELRILPSSSVLSARMATGLTIFTLGVNEPKIVHTEDLLAGAFIEGKQAIELVELQATLRATALNAIDSKALITGMTTSLQ